ncbi:guanylate cyclase [Pseudoscourfieldia marina]
MAAAWRAACNNNSTINPRRATTTSMVAVLLLLTTILLMSFKGLLLCDAQQQQEQPSPPQPSSSYTTTPPLPPSTDDDDQQEEVNLTTEAAKVSSPPPPMQISCDASKLSRFVYPADAEDQQNSSKLCSSFLLVQTTTTTTTPFNSFATGLRAAFHKASSSASMLCLTLHICTLEEEEKSDNNQKNTQQTLDLSSFVGLFASDELATIKTARLWNHSSSSSSSSSHHHHLPLIGPATGLNSLRTKDPFIRNVVNVRVGIKEEIAALTEALFEENTATNDDNNSLDDGRRRSSTNRGGGGEDEQVGLLSNEDVIGFESIGAIVAHHFPSSEDVISAAEEQMRARLHPDLSVIQEWPWNASEDEIQRVFEAVFKPSGPNQNKPVPRALFLHGSAKNVAHFAKLASDFDMTTTTRTRRHLEASDDDHASRVLLVTSATGAYELNRELARVFATEPMWGGSTTANNSAVTTSTAEFAASSATTAEIHTISVAISQVLPTMALASGVASDSGPAAELVDEFRDAMKRSPPLSSESTHHSSPSDTAFEGYVVGTLTTQLLVDATRSMREAYKIAQDCACTGINTGINETIFGRGYGTSCAAWEVRQQDAASGLLLPLDLDKCEALWGPDAPLTNTSVPLGGWCCQQWCYVSRSCPGARLSSSSPESMLFYSYSPTDCPSTPARECLARYAASENNVDAFLGTEEASSLEKELANDDDGKGIKIAAINSLRAAMLDSLYNQGIWEVGGKFRLGPYGDTCFQPGTGCYCNSGLHSVYMLHSHEPGIMHGAHTTPTGSPVLTFGGCRLNTAAPDPIIIGQSCALTGPTSALGLGMNTGMQIGVDEIDALGGVAGTFLNLAAVDDGYEPNRAADNVPVLLEENGAALLAGFVGTPTSKAVVEWLEANNRTDVPFIAPFTGAGLLRMGQRSIINIRASYGDETAAMVMHFVGDLGMRRIAIFAQEDSFGRAGYDGLVAALQLTKVPLYAEGWYIRNTVDVAAGVDAILGSYDADPVPEPPQLIVMIGAYKPLAAFVTAVRARVQKTGSNVPVFTTVSFVGTAAFSAALATPENRENVWITQVVPNPNGQGDFARRYRAALRLFDANLEPDFVSYEGYIAMRFIDAVLMRMGEVYRHGLNSREFVRDLRKKFLDTVYEPPGIFILDQQNLVIGPYFEEEPGYWCNQGLRTVWLTKLNPSNGEALYGVDGVTPFQYSTCGYDALSRLEEEQINFDVGRILGIIAAVILPLLFICCLISALLVRRYVRHREAKAIMETWHIEYDDLTFLHPLGEGAQGTTWYGRYSGTEVVIKQIDAPPKSQRIGEGRRSLHSKRTPPSPRPSSLESSSPKDSAEEAAAGTVVKASLPAAMPLTMRSISKGIVARLRMQPQQCKPMHVSQLPRSIRESRSDCADMTHALTFTSEDDAAVAAAAAATAHHDDNGDDDGHPSSLSTGMAEAEVNTETVAATKNDENNGLPSALRRGGSQITRNSDGSQNDVDGTRDAFKRSVSLSQQDDSVEFASLSQRKNTIRRGFTSIFNSSSSRGKTVDREFNVLHRLRHPNIRLFMGAYLGVASQKRKKKRESCKEKKKKKTSKFNEIFAMMTRRRERKTGSDASDVEDVEGGGGNGDDGDYNECQENEEKERLHPRSSILIVSEYMTRGNLHDILSNPTLELDWEMRLSFCRDMARGLMYLHSQEPPVLHQDLKSHNMLVDDRWNVKVGDFGHSAVLNEVLGRSVTGTPLWTAPEVLSGKPNTQASDVYGLGIVFWEVLSRRDPYDDETTSRDDIIQQIIAGVRPRMPAAGGEGGVVVPESMTKLIMTCWSSDPESRPTMMEVSKMLDSMVSSNELTLGGRMRSSSTGVSSGAKLLVNRMLPARIARALEDGQPVQPEHFDDVTILFSDIVGYTAISSSLPPGEVMDMLNRLYTAFDALTTRHGLFKVETIGDAYMVVGGCPEAQPDHAVRIARMALDMLETAATIPVSNMSDDFGTICIRVGLHSGPVVGSVVGDLQPRYTLFGDTVNVASRMESTSLAKMAQVSSATYQRLVDSGETGAFTLQPRGETTVKGKGMMHTYWLRPAGHLMLLGWLEALVEKHGLDMEDVKSIPESYMRTAASEEELLACTRLRHLDAFKLGARYLEKVSMMGGDPSVALGTMLSVDVELLGAVRTLEELRAVVRIAAQAAGHVPPEEVAKKGEDAAAHTSVSSSSPLKKSSATKAAEPDHVTTMSANAKLAQATLSHLQELVAENRVFLTRFSNVPSQLLDLICKREHMMWLLSMAHDESQQQQTLESPLASQRMQHGTFAEDTTPSQEPQYERQGSLSSTNTYSRSSSLRMSGTAMMLKWLAVCVSTEALWRFSTHYHHYHPADAATAAATEAENVAETISSADKLDTLRRVPHSLYTMANSLELMKQVVRMEVEGSHAALEAFDEALGSGHDASSAQDFHRLLNECPPILLDTAESGDDVQALLSWIKASPDLVKLLGEACISQLTAAIEKRTSASLHGGRSFANQVTLPRLRHVPHVVLTQLRSTEHVMKVLSLEKRCLECLAELFMDDEKKKGREDYLHHRNDERDDESRTKAETVVVASDDDEVTPVQDRRSRVPAAPSPTSSEAHAKHQVVLTRLVLSPKPLLDACKTTGDLHTVLHEWLEPVGEGGRRRRDARRAFNEDDEYEDELQRDQSSKKPNVALVKVLSRIVSSDASRFVACRAVPTALLQTAGGDDEVNVLVELACVNADVMPWLAEFVGSGEYTLNDAVMLPRNLFAHIKTREQLAWTLGIRSSTSAAYNVGGVSSSHFNDVAVSRSISTNAVLQTAATRRLMTKKSKLLEELARLEQKLDEQSSIGSEKSVSAAAAAAAAGAVPEASNQEE